MKILFDEGVPKAIRKRFSQHQVDTVQERGWDRIQNGKLLSLIEQQGYEVFITGDKNMSYQQVLASRNFAILVLSTNHWPTASEHIQSIVSAVHQAVPGRVIEVDCGYYSPKKKHPFLMK